MRNYCLQIVCLSVPLVFCSACNRDSGEQIQTSPAEPATLTTRTLREELTELIETYHPDLKLPDVSDVEKKPAEELREEYEALHEAFVNLSDPRNRNADKATGDKYKAERDKLRKDTLRAIVAYLDTQPAYVDAQSARGAFRRLAYDALPDIPGYRVYRLDGWDCETTLREKYESLDAIDVDMAESCAKWYERGFDYACSVRVLQWTLDRMADSAARVIYRGGSDSSRGRRLLVSALEEKLRAYQARIPEMAAEVAKAEEGFKWYKDYVANPPPPESLKFGRAAIPKEVMREDEAVPEPGSDAAKRKEAMDLSGRGEYMQAAALYEELGDREGLAWCLHSQATALMGENQKEEQRNQLTALMEKYPDTQAGRDASRQLVSAYTEQGAYDKALELLDAQESAEKAAGYDISGVLFEKARILQHAGRPDEALALAQEVKKGFPAGAVSFLMTDFESLCHVQLGQNEQAIALWEELIAAVEAGAEILDAGEEGKDPLATPSPQVVAIGQAEQRIEEIKKGGNPYGVPGNPPGANENR